ncbi:MAG: hypothetical protein ACOCT7_00065 [Candidatus Saliniplasma sp.]
MLDNRDLTSDERGDIPGLPMEMLIISVVMLISIPLIFSYSSMYVRRQTESDLRVQLDKMVEIFEEVKESEAGNRRTFSLDLNDHPLARVSYVEIGGKDHHLRTTIRYKLKDNSEVALSLDGLEASGRTDGDFTNVQLPLDGGTVLIEYSHHLDFVQISVGE